jgi:hypothetical protein
MYMRFVFQRLTVFFPLLWCRLVFKMESWGLPFIRITHHPHFVQGTIMHPLTFDVIVDSFSPFRSPPTSSPSTSSSSHVILSVQHGRHIPRLCHNMHSYGGGYLHHHLCARQLCRGVCVAAFLGVDRADDSHPRLHSLAIVSIATLVYLRF